MAAQCFRSQYSGVDLHRYDLQGAAFQRVCLLRYDNHTRLHDSQGVTAGVRIAPDRQYWGLSPFQRRDDPGDRDDIPSFVIVNYQRATHGSQSK
jgi:hypothetical protein